jgi:integrase
MPKILYTVDAINARLKAKGSKVRVEVRAQQAINLRATLPPKPMSNRVLPYQQRIPLNLLESASGLKRAEYEAEKLHGALLYNTFDWADYATAKTVTGSTTAEIVELFKVHYFANNDLSERTWANNWAKYFDRLPQSGALSVEAMERVIKSTGDRTYSRRNVIAVMKNLAEFAGLSVNFSRFASNKVRGRNAIDIPPDELLFKTRDEIACENITAHEGWRWIYSILLLAGLRPHEAFFCEWSDLGLEVLQGKTGKRTIFNEVFELLYPSEVDGCASLVDEWGLRNIKLPGIKNAQASYEKGKLGNKVCIRWLRWELPFSPYSMRHAFAIRASVTHADKIRTATAAALMGHSEDTHVRVYHRWLSAAHNQELLRASLEKQKTSKLSQ